MTSKKSLDHCRAPLPRW